MRALVKNKVVKARVICEELYSLNEDSLELVQELISDDELNDKYGETLENLKENLEKVHNLL